MENNKKVIYAVYPFRVEQDILNDFRMLAKAEDRSLASYLRRALMDIRQQNIVELNRLQREFARENGTETDVAPIRGGVGMNPPAHSMEGEWWKRPEYNGAPLSGDDDSEDLIDGDNMDDREDLI